MSWCPPLAATIFYRLDACHADSPGAGAGVVHWSPPAAALEVAEQRLREPGLSAYGPCAGMPALVAALKAKLAAENGLEDVSSPGLSLPPATSTSPRTEV